MQDGRVVRDVERSGRARWSSGADRTVGDPCIVATRGGVRGILGLPAPRDPDRPDASEAEAPATVSATATPRRRSATASARERKAAPDPRPPAPQRHRGERPPRRHRRGGRRRPARPRARRPGAASSRCAPPSSRSGRSPSSRRVAWRRSAWRRTRSRSSPARTRARTSTSGRIQAIYRRAGVSQALLACGSEGSPLDALTAARLARDGEKAGPIRHMCSGQHSVSLLLSRLNGWEQDDYWHTTIRRRSPTGRPSPARTARRRNASGPPSTAAASRRSPSRCARSPGRTRSSRIPPAVPADDTRSAVAGPPAIVRDAMLANPEMVAGRHDRLDTSVMKAAPGRLVSKSGMEALRGVAHPARTARRDPGHRGDRPGDQDRGRRRLRSRDLGGVRGGASPGRASSTVRRCASWRATTGRRRSIRTAGSSAEAIPDFELAPVGELIG